MLLIQCAQSRLKRKSISTPSSLDPFTGNLLHDNNVCIARNYHSGHYLCPPYTANRDVLQAHAVCCHFAQWRFLVLPLAAVLCSPCVFCYVLAIDTFWVSITETRAAGNSSEKRKPSTSQINASETNEKREKEKKTKLRVKEPDDIKMTNQPGNHHAYATMLAVNNKNIPECL